MREEIAYFFNSLDMYLSFGKSPEDALALTVKDYAHVYFGEEGTELSRSAERALLALERECTCRTVDGTRYPSATEPCPRHGLLDQRGLEIDGDAPAAS
jgi:hypothetical protein